MLFRGDRDAAPLTSDCKFTRRPPQANPNLEEVRLFAASQYSDVPLVSIYGGALRCPQLQAADVAAPCYAGLL